MAENTFELKIIAPDEMFFEGTADFLEFTSTNGEMGVYAQHLPTTVILEPGVVSIHQNGEVKRVAVMGGFVQILKTEITLMAEDAQWPEEIDVNRAKEAAERAKKRLASKDAAIDVKRAEAALKRAMARINTVN